MANNYSLTKENFWNGLKKECPLMMDYFCQWIDKYKKEIEWDKLFNDGYENNEGITPLLTRSPKYHDLPIAMQLGVVIEFSLDTGRSIIDYWQATQWELENFDWIKDSIHAWFCEREKFFQHKK